MIIVNSKRKKITVFKQPLTQQALDWASWVQARGGTVDPVILSKVNKYFFVPAIANGNILNKVLRLCVYKGTGNTTAATTNLISNNYHATLHAVPPAVTLPTWSNSEGFSVPTGQTGYLNWNLNPATLGGAWLTDNLTGIYLKNASFAAIYKTFGNRGATGRYAHTRATGTTTTIYANGAALNNGIAHSTSGIKKYYFGSKSIGVQTAFNTTPAGTTTAAQTPLTWQNFNFYELTQNNNGSPDGNYDPTPHCVSFLASNSVDLAALEIILDDLLFQL